MMSASNRLMVMFDWLAARFGMAPYPVVPVMIRVRDAAGRLVSRVHLAGTFAPGTDRLDKTVVTAGGTCLIDWPGRTQRLHLRVSAGASSAQLELESRRPDPEQVVEVRLREACVRHSRSQDVDTAPVAGRTIRAY